MSSVRLVSAPVQSLPFSSIGAAYMGIGTAFADSARAVVIENYTNQTLLFSLDGITDHFNLPVKSSFLMTITQNADEATQYFALEAGNRIYVKQSGVAPWKGTVYVTELRGVNDA